MATSNSAPADVDEGINGDSSSERSRPETSLGIDHLTVVPENFDPETGRVEQ